MKTMKKCLLFLGLIGIMGAIKTDYNSSKEERIANQVIDRMQQIEQQKQEEKRKQVQEVIIKIFATIGGFACVCVTLEAGFSTLEFFSKLAKNAAICANNAAKCAETC